MQLKSSKEAILWGRAKGKGDLCRTARYIAYSLGIVILALTYNNCSVSKISTCSCHFVTWIPIHRAWLICYSGRKIINTNKSYNANTSKRTVTANRTNVVCITFTWSLSGNASGYAEVRDKSKGWRIKRFGWRNHASWSVIVILKFSLVKWNCSIHATIESSPSSGFHECSSASIGIFNSGLWYSTLHQVRSEIQSARK